LERLKRKIVLLGDAAVGKTSLIRKFVLDKFDDSYITTIGTKVMKKEIVLKEQKTEMILMIWDIIGQKDYRRLQSVSFSGAQGAIVVLDRTREDTLTSIPQYWLPKLREHAPTVPVIIAANKSDLVEQIIIKPSRMDKLSKEHSCQIIPTSAKTGENVEEMFTRMAELCFYKQPMPSLLGDETEISNLSMACDAIIFDFARLHGDINDAMPYVRQQAKASNLDINAPVKETLTAFVEKLYSVEVSYTDEKSALENKKRRMNFIKKGEEAVIQ